MLTVALVQFQIGKIQEEFCRWAATAAVVYSEIIVVFVPRIERQVRSVATPQKPRV